ncbi:hypothetical protein GCM10017788_13170 [Amycolatopsis acidiphila]|nr:hypothetical protein GCM10017788_13170 [Amycolatopsis acidiphila]
MLSDDVVTARVRASMGRVSDLSRAGTANRGCDRPLKAVWVSFASQFGYRRGKLGIAKCVRS